MNIWKPVTLAILLPFSAQSAPISVDNFGNPWELFHFRSVRGATSVFGGPQGPLDTLGFGLTNVVPNGKGEDNGVFVTDTPTTVVASQNGITIDVPFNPDSFSPNEFSTGIAYDPAFTDSWDLTVTNGNDIEVFHTPSVGLIDAPDRVTSVALTSGTDPTLPTISWVNGDADIDKIHIEVFNLLDRSAGTGRANRVHIENLAIDATSFQMPTGILEADGLYSIMISSQIDRKTGTNPSGSSQAGAALVRGDTFFDFSTSTLPVDQQVYLPELSFGPGDAPIFNFNNPVIAGQVEYYDPVVAVGYVYEIGNGDPLFNSVVLPDIGDGLFEVQAMSGTDWMSLATVMAGVEYQFAGGIDKFRVTGIETSAGLDPNDTQAFVTGLSFVSSGQFTGTMTPITVDIAPVPLPLSASLYLLALGGLVFTWRKRGS